MLAPVGCHRQVARSPPRLPVEVPSEPVMNSANIVHPSTETLNAYSAGQLDSFSADPVRQHLETCPECRRRLQQSAAPNSTPSPTKPLSQLAALLEGRPLDQVPTSGTLPPELVAHSQYEIIRLLGRGGMGVVYLAKNKLMDRLEVLKVINKALMDRPGSLERFLREIRSAGQLNHVNVVKAYSALPLGELLVFAMEYVDGEDLAKYVQSHGPLPVVNACYYARQVAQGLQHAHEKGMVHRDIKPQNLMLSKEGKKHVIKILDFGLAKISREKGMERDLTGQGWMLGTPDYMAPEQITDAANADIRADIYSLGCTLYFLLTGAPCFQGKSVLELLQAHQSVDPRPLHLVRPGVTPELSAVVAKMLAKDPAKRYQTPAEVADALKGFIKSGSKEGEVGSAPPSPAPEATLAAGTRNSPGPTSATAPLPTAQLWVDERIAPASRFVGARPDREVLPAGMVAAPTKKGRSPLLWVAVAAAGVLCVGLLAALGIAIAMWNANHPTTTPLASATSSTSTTPATSTKTSVASTETETATKDTATKVPPPPPPPQKGVLVLQQVPNGAKVLVDGKQAGDRVGDGHWELPVDPGSHTVEVRKAGFEPFKKTVTVKSGTQEPVLVNMLATVSPTLIALEKLPADAEVFLDGIKKSLKSGPKGTFEISTSPGSHKLEIRKTGYKSYITERTFVAGERLVIPISLEAVTTELAKAPANSQRTETVNKYLNDAVIRVTNVADKVNILNFGYESGISIFGGWVEHKKDLQFDITLQAGVEYLILAGGDGDALDVDLAILDASGTVVAKDEETNPDAVVPFTPKATGRFTIKMILFDSKDKAPCVCVTCILKKDGWRVPVHNLDAAVGKMLKGMAAADKALIDQAGKRMYQGPGQWTFYGGVLKQGESMSMGKLNFGSGERRFIGAGDDFSSAVKLQIEDAKSKALKADTFVNPVSVLDYQVAGAVHNLRIYNTQATGPSVVVMSVFDIYQK
jgi:serine/threonine protein kinase